MVILGECEYGHESGEFMCADFEGMLANWKLRPVHDYVHGDDPDDPDDHDCDHGYVDGDEHDDSHVRGRDYAHDDGDGAHDDHFRTHPRVHDAPHIHKHKLH